MNYDNHLQLMRELWALRINQNKTFCHSSLRCDMIKYQPDLVYDDTFDSMVVFESMSFEIRLYSYNINSYIDMVNRNRRFI